MFPSRKREETPLEKAIDEAIRYLDPTSKDFTELVNNIERLHKLKEQEAPKRVSPDMQATVASNLLGILLILHYERVNVVTSKALSFVKKLM